MAKDFECFSLGEMETAEAVFAGEYSVPMARAPSVVLDIGANIGAFSRWAADKWPGCQIHAYEPQEEAAAWFRKNLGKEAILHEVALRSFTGIDNLRIGKNNTCQSGFVPQKWQSDRTVAVNCDAASTAPAADFIKIDTEGCELEILKGLDLSNAQAIAVEFHSEHDNQEITQFLTGNGFYLHQRFPTLMGCGIAKFTRGVIKNRSFIAIPIYGEVHPWFMVCLQRLMDCKSLDCLVRYQIGDSLVTRARNTLTADFLQTNCDQLLFIDSDLIFSIDHVRRVLDHPHDVVGGCYPKKKAGEVEWVLNLLDEGGTVADPGGLQRVKYVGTGFMKVRRSVFDTLSPKCQQYANDNWPHRKERDFWKVGVYNFKDGTSRYLSEDWYFCQDWGDCGGKVFADTATVLKHIGTVAYPVGGAVHVEHTEATD